MKFLLILLSAAILCSCKIDSVNGDDVLTGSNNFESEHYKDERYLLIRFFYLVSRNGNELIIKNKGKVVKKFTNIKGGEDNCFLNDVIYLKLGNSKSPKYYPVVMCYWGEWANFLLIDSEGNFIKAEHIDNLGEREFISSFTGPLSSSPNGKLLILGDSGDIKNIYELSHNMIIYNSETMNIETVFEEECKPFKWISEYRFVADCSEKNGSHFYKANVQKIEDKWVLDRNLN